MGNEYTHDSDTRIQWSDNLGNSFILSYRMLSQKRDHITEREVTFTYQMAFIWSCKWKWKSLSPVWLFEIPGLYSPWNSLCQNTGVGSLSLLQGIFPTQGSRSGLPHCRQILYQLSHQESPYLILIIPFLGLSWWLRGKESICNTGAAGDMSLFPGRGGHSNPL